MVRVYLDFQWKNSLLWDLKNIEHTSSIAYILCKKNDCDILKNIIIEIPMIFGNQQVSILNIFVPDDLALLVILLGKELSSPNIVSNVSYIPKYNNLWAYDRWWLY